MFTWLYRWLTSRRVLRVLILILLVVLLVAAVIGLWYVNFRYRVETDLQSPFPTLHATTSPRTRST